MTTPARSRPHRYFRQHETLEVHDGDHVFNALVIEWASVNTSVLTKTQVRRWHKQEPILAGYTTPGQIVDAIDDLKESADKIRLIQALMRLLVAGQQLAGRTLLQAFLPKLSRMSKADAHQEGFDDRASRVIGSFWEVITSLDPANAKPGRIVLDTLKQFKRDSPDSDDLTTIPSDHTSWDHAADEDSSRASLMVSSARERMVNTQPPPQPDASTEDISSEDNLEQIMLWALEQGFVNADDYDLMLTAYCGPKHDFATAAANLGISTDAAKKRCSRVSQRIHDAVAEHIQQRDIREAPDSEQQPSRSRRST